MTSSIVNWKESSKNGRPWKSQEFMVVFKSLRSVNLSDNITDSVIFSNFSENHRKVRKFSIWLIQQAMEISTFWYEQFSFFRSDYCSLNYALGLCKIDSWIWTIFSFFNSSSSEKINILSQELQKCGRESFGTDKR